MHWAGWRAPRTERRVVVDWVATRANRWAGEKGSTSVWCWGSVKVSKWGFELDCHRKGKKMAASSEIEWATVKDSYWDDVMGGWTAASKAVVKAA